jgi:hypothetical protein
MVGTSEAELRRVQEGGGSNAADAAAAAAARRQASMHLKGELSP